MSTQTQIVPMNTKAIMTLFGFTHGVFRQNTAEVTHEESLRQPQPGGNCINWVGGHLAATRQGMLQMLGHAPTWTEDEMAFYRRGSSPVTTGVGAMRWERIAEDFDATQPLLMAGLAKLSPEDLAAPLPADRNPFKLDSLAEQMAVFNFHESYHVGQLGLLRRLVGKAGAIK